MFSHLQCIFKQFSKSEAEQQDRRLTISVLNESCVDSSCHFPVDLRFRRKIIRDRSGSPKNTSLALGFRRCRSISGRLTESRGQRQAFCSGSKERNPVPSDSDALPTFPASPSCHLQGSTNITFAQKSFPPLNAL